jgi:HlyD family secretion protein
MPEGSLAPEQVPATLIRRVKAPLLRRPRRAAFVLLGAVVGLVIIGVMMLRSSGGKPPVGAVGTPRASLTVTAGTVGTKRMAEALLVVGSLVPWEDLSIGTEAAGLTVTQILVEEGDRVTAGQLMAKLDDALIAAQIKANEAQIEHAKATIGQQDALIAEAEANTRSAQNDVKRGQELLKSSAISVQTLEAREATAASVQARVQSARMGRQVAQADFALAQSQHAELAARFAQTEIRAPADGVVSKRFVRIGKVLVGAGSDELFHMVRDNILELDAEVPDRLLARVQPGQKVKLASVTADGHPIYGTVRAVAPLVDAATRKGIAHVRFPSDPNLKPGMFVSGELLLAESDQLALPESAIVFKDGAALVFVLDDNNRVSQRKVQTGLRTEGSVAILSGLGPEDRVVLSGAGFLSDGDRVRVADANPS